MTRILEPPDSEAVHSDEERALAQYRTREQFLYTVLREASVPPEFPIVVEDGWFHVELTATRAQIPLGAPAPREAPRARLTGW